MKKLSLTLFFALALVMFQAVPGWCGRDVSLKARPGLSGIYKVNRPVLIRVDIDSRGDGIAGQLVVAPRDQEMPSERNKTLYITAVDVPAGGKVTRDLVVPGELAARSPMVRLVAGGNILAEAGLEGAGLSGGLVILPLGEKVFGSSLFTWLDKKYGGQVTVKYLPPEELPEKSLFLGAADVIVVDREASVRLGPGQVRALKEWVRLGGTLLVSGEAGAAGGPFGDIITAIQAQSGNLARKTLGRGEVILSRTPVEDIKDPEGKTWEDMELIPGGKRIPGDRDFDIKHMLADAGSYLPMSKSPGISLLVILWVAYSLALGPGLYLLLRRLNRRDLAWVLVPAGAALTALFFYTMSPVNRLQAYLAHTTATVEIVDHNLAEVRASGTFVLPRGGSLEVNGSGQMHVEPVNIYSGRRGRPVLAFNDGKESRVVFDGVEYGSMRQVHSQGILSGVGGIGGSIFFRDHRVMGEISNNTPLNLRDCRLQVGKSLLDLGDIPAGGVKKLDEPFNWALIANNPGEPYPYGRYPAKIQETRIINDFTVHREVAGEVYFLGWSDSPPDDLKVVRPSGQGKTSGLTLVRQKMDLQFPGGAFRLPEGFIKYTVSGLGGGYGTGPDGRLVVHRGSVQISYDLAGTLKKDNFRVTAVDVPQAPDRSVYTVEIYRQDESRWEQVDKNGQRFSGKDAARYLSGKGKIEIKVTSPVDKGEGMFAGITVEGVIGE